MLGASFQRGRHDGRVAFALPLLATKSERRTKCRFGSRATLCTAQNSHVVRPGEYTLRKQTGWSQKTTPVSRRGAAGLKLGVSWAGFVSVHPASRRRSHFMADAAGLPSRPSAPFVQALGIIWRPRRGLHFVFARSTYPTAKISGLRRHHDRDRRADRPRCNRWWLGRRFLHPRSSYRRHYQRSQPGPPAGRRYD